MSKQQRIDHFNHWPLAQEFQGEVKYAQLIEKFDLKDLFIPYHLPASDDKGMHITVSYMLDAVDSLPKRPDHAFDWTWRAFEHTCKRHPRCDVNTSAALRVISDELFGYYTKNGEVGDAVFKLISLIPLRTCKFFLKKIVKNAPYVFVDANAAGKSSLMAKRILFANGNPPVTSWDVQTVLSFLASKYHDSASGDDQRSGASLLRRVLRGETVMLGEVVEVKLSRKDIFFLVLSGVGYEFRNGRAHAESIAPFRSSFAKIPTYAHCWFMFVFMYEVTFSILHMETHPEFISGSPAANFQKNNDAYLKLFGGHLGS